MLPEKVYFLPRLCRFPGCGREVSVVLFPQFPQKALLLCPEGHRFLYDQEQEVVRDWEEGNGVPPCEELDSDSPQRKEFYIV